MGKNKNIIGEIKYKIKSIKLSLTSRLFNDTK